MKDGTKTAKEHTVCQLKPWYTRPLCNQGLWHPRVFFTSTTDVIFALWVSITSVSDLISLRRVASVPSLCVVSGNELRAELQRMCPLDVGSPLQCISSALNTGERINVIVSVRSVKRKFIRTSGLKSTGCFVSYSVKLGGWVLFWTWFCRLWAYPSPAYTISNNKNLDSNSIFVKWSNRDIIEVETR